MRTLSHSSGKGSNPATPTFTQLDLFQPDARPLPLIVAEKWGFALQHHAPNGDRTDRLYSVQDWIMGLTQTNNPRDLWCKLKARNELYVSIRQLPYQAANNKTYQMDFAADVDLYLITQDLREIKTRKTLSGALDAIRSYLANAGVLLDRARRDPQAAAELTETLSKHHQTRLEGIVTRNELTAWLRAAFGSGFAFGQFTNMEYTGLFGRTAAEIRKTTGKKNARDGMTTEALAFVTIVESSCLRLFEGRDQVREIEAFEIVSKVAEPLGANVKLLQEQLGIDLATGTLLIDECD